MLFIWWISIPFSDKTLKIWHYFYFDFIFITFCFMHSTLFFSLILTFLLLFGSLSLVWKQHFSEVFQRTPLSLDQKESECQRKTTLEVIDKFRRNFFYRLMTQKPGDCRFYHQMTAFLHHQSHPEAVTFSKVDVLQWPKLKLSEENRRR